MNDYRQFVWRRNSSLYGVACTRGDISWSLFWTFWLEIWTFFINFGLVEIHLLDSENRG